ncbi:MAG: hypothetical protein WBW88_04735 [Rhodothermales bacterium]
MIEQVVPWIELSLALVFTALGQLCYKVYFVRRRRLYVILAITLFVLVPPFAFLALRHLGLGLVYMSTALTQLMVLGLSRVVLKERIGGAHVVAMALIVAGVVLYGI